MDKRWEKQAVARWEQHRAQATSPVAATRDSELLCGCGHMNSHVHKVAPGRRDLGFSVSFCFEERNPQNFEMLK